MPPARRLPSWLIGGLGVVLLLVVCYVSHLQYALLRSTPEGARRAQRQALQQQKQPLDGARSDRGRQQQQQQQQQQQPTALSGERQEGESGSDSSASASSAASGGLGGSAGVGFIPPPSRLRCVGDNTTLPSKLYGAKIVNRTCLYEGLVVLQQKWYFIDFTHTRGAQPRPAAECPDLPEVSLASKPILIGKQSFKKVYAAAYAQLMFGYRWRPKRLCSVADYTDAVAQAAAKLGDHLSRAEPRQIGGLTTMYSPEVAPWNYAHTLFNELFPLYWGMVDLGEVARDARVLVYGALYDQSFQPDRKKWLPQNNALVSFSTRPAQYDRAFLEMCDASAKKGDGICVVEKLLVGSGAGKTWAAVTPDYASPGSLSMWSSFRSHILGVLGVGDTARAAVAAAAGKGARPDEGGGGASEGQGTPYRMVVCDKKSDSLDKKRGIINTDELVQWAQEAFPGKVSASAVVLTKMRVKEQTALMSQTDIFMCNEGTMGTAFFLLPPGSVWLSVMNVFRRDEAYDLYRPHSTKHLFWNTGGNIDWFAPTIRWVKAIHYDRYLMEDVVKDTSHSNYRNYLPNWSVRIRKERFLQLMRRAVGFLDSGREETDTDNHSVMGGMCSRMMKKAPQLRPLFTSIKCAYGMSWFCEYLVNGHQVHRNGHPKWRRGCGRQPTPQQLNVTDPRDAWLKEEGIAEAPRAYNCEPSPANKYPCPTQPPPSGDAKEASG